MRDDRSNSFSVPVKIGIGLIALLFILNSAFLYLFVREKKRNNDYVRIMKETNEKLLRVREALNRQSGAPPADTVVKPSPAPAQPTVARSEPKQAPPAPPEKKAVQVEEPTKATPPLERVVKLVVPPESTPAPFVSADAGEIVLICEKDSKTLHVFRFGNGRFSLVKSYPCIIGANNGDKRKAGDAATPKGVYFIMRFTPGSKLPGDYGTGAFVLSYPNLLDRKNGKQGNGIWLHGHDNKKNLNDLLNTKGCIVVTNDVIKELSAIIVPQSTPIAIVDTLKFVPQKDQRAAGEEIKGFVSSWRHAWESINTKKYLSFYSSDFINNEGMNYDAFRNYKEKVNSNKKSILIKVERTAILLPQDHENKLAVVRFDQRYQSNNYKSDSRKLLYLKKSNHGWQIIGESILH